MNRPLARWPARRSLILASASPRRRQLLKRLGVPFRVVPSDIPEPAAHKNPIRLVQELALRKAVQVAARMKGAVVLGADTVVVLHRRILGKPRNRQGACRMLQKLSGTTHKVYTGVALVEAGTGRKAVSYAVSTVKMRKMPLEDLRKFSRKHLDKAGAYAIQERRDPIARVVRGSYDNVVGLPVGLVRKMLRHFKFQIANLKFEICNAAKRPLKKPFRDVGCLPGSDLPSSW
jgi:septum formation protein